MSSRVLHDRKKIEAALLTTFGATYGMRPDVLKRLSDYRLRRLCSKVIAAERLRRIIHSIVHDTPTKSRPVFPVPSQTRL